MAADWTFFTNHAHVLFCIAREPRTRLRDIASCVGITERAAHRIVSALCEAGYVSRRRVGQRNVYEVNSELPLRHPLEREHTVGEILDVLLDDRAARQAA